MEKDKSKTDLEKKKAFEISEEDLKKAGRKEDEALRHEGTVIPEDKGGFLPEEERKKSKKDELEENPSDKVKKGFQERPGRNEFMNDEAERNVIKQHTSTRRQG